MGLSLARARALSLYLSHTQTLTLALARARACSLSLSLIVQRNSTVSFSSLSMKVFFPHSSMFIALTGFLLRLSKSIFERQPSIFVQPN